MVIVHDEMPSDIEHYDLCVQFPIDSKTQTLEEAAEIVIEKFTTVFGAKYLYFLRHSPPRKGCYAMRPRKHCLFLLIRGHTHFHRFKTIRTKHRLLHISVIPPNRFCDFAKQIKHIAYNCKSQLLERMGSRV